MKENDVQTYLKISKRNENNLLNNSIKKICYNSNKYKIIPISYLSVNMLQRMETNFPFALQ